MSTVNFNGYLANVTVTDGIFTFEAPAIGENGTTFTATSLEKGYKVFQEIVFDWLQYTRDINSRKVKMCFIPLIGIMELFTGKKQLVLPEGAEALDVHYDFMRNSFGLKIWHKAFEPVEPGVEIAIYPYKEQSGISDFDKKTTLAFLKCLAGNAPVDVEEDWWVELKRLLTLYA